MNVRKITLMALVAMLLYSCIDDPVVDEPKVFESLDEELIDLMKNESETGDLRYYSLPASVQLDDIPADSRNQLTYEKVELGKLLFHEPGLGVIPKNQDSKGTYSCASCHHVGAGFQAGVKQGIGEGGEGFGEHGEMRRPIEGYGFDFIDIQPIRSPSILNTAYQEVMLWNGQFGAKGVNEGTEENWALRSPKEVNFLGFEGLETQAIAALKVHRLHVNEEIVDTLGYKELFDKAFADEPVEHRYNDTIAGLAIAAYERTVLASQAPFQDWIRGDEEAMNDNEKKGAILFFGKAGCVNCHTGPALSSMNFYALGMKDFTGEEITQTIAQDFFTSAQGRGGFTNREEDLYKFKVPQLYNLKDSPFYGHGGSFRSIKSVLEYKNEAIPENYLVPEDKLHPGFLPKGLTVEEIENLTSFIENALYDDNLVRFVPTSLPSGMCFPNNDEQSRIDLGCL